MILFSKEAHTGSDKEGDMSNVKTYKKNSVIFFEGEKGETMFDIIWGSVGIYSNYGKPDQKLLTRLEPDSFFGEMGMIENLPRSATAVALEDTDVMEITFEGFSKYLEKKPAKAYTILEHTSKRLRELSCDYVEACIAINEYVNNEENGEKQSSELMAKMKKISAARSKKK